MVIAATCSHEAEVVGLCVRAEDNREPGAAGLCETAWQDTDSEDAAVAGAHRALCDHDDAVLERWAQRTRPTVKGARILHYWGQLQFERGDLDGAERTFRRALPLRVDRDPARATNTALQLLKLVRSTQPVEQSIELARLAWDQAVKGDDSLARAFAAGALADLLIDLGELEAAQTVIQRMDPADSRALKDIAEGTLRAAQGRTDLAVRLFRRADHEVAGDAGSHRPLEGRIRLVQALVDIDQIDLAHAALDSALESAQQHGSGALDAASRLAAVRAEVYLAEGRVSDALEAVESGLAASARDAARVLLLDVRGDALASRGDVLDAEQAWCQAADEVEKWRASIPSHQLRSGLVAHHRHALEAWLESTAQRHDIAGALEVTRRLLGRGLLDRIREREAAADVVRAPAAGPASAPSSADASIDRVVQRLAAQRELAATISSSAPLSETSHDLVAIVSGTRSTWAIRRLHGCWSIDRVGDRASIVAQVDAFRRAIDDEKIAASLGAALFPRATLPDDGEPIAVLLDRELADIALAGLRVDDAYLVERAPIVEVLAPELLFAPVRDGAWGPAVVLGDAAGDLPSAGREASAVAQRLAVAPQLGTRATRRVLASAAHARVVHVATHAANDGEGAALMLADGAVSSLDIFRRRLAPRLAVIATCRSQVNDDPTASLVSAFLAAGAAGAIGVKRALDDGDGAKLMLAFYGAGGADDPVRALAEAQRAAIADGRKPSAWATVSFFGVGGWIRTRSERCQSGQ